MKKLLYLIFALTTAVFFVTSCTGNDTWDTYKEWREANQSWLNEQLSLKNPDGTPFYTNIKPNWYPESGVLIHYFNDRSETEGNLSPMINSTVDVKYIGKLYNEIPFDSSFTMTVYGDSIYRFQPVNTITGWQVAITNMRVGDSARVVVPFMEGYGASTSSSIIPPYSNLVFDIKLVDIYKYELP